MREPNVFEWQEIERRIAFNSIPDSYTISFTKNRTMFYLHYPDGRIEFCD